MSRPSSIFLFVEYTISGIKGFKFWALNPSLLILVSSSSVKWYLTGSICNNSFKPCVVSKFFFVLSSDEAGDQDVAFAFNWTPSVLVVTKI